MTTVYLHALLLALLLTAKLSRYLLSLLLASVLFFAGSESLSESQILLLLTAETQKQIHHSQTHTLSNNLSIPAFICSYIRPAHFVGKTQSQTCETWIYLHSRCHYLYSRWI